MKKKKSVGSQIKKSYNPIGSALKAAGHALMHGPKGYKAPHHGVRGGSGIKVPKPPNFSSKKKKSY